MSIHDTDDQPVLDALKHSLAEVTMPGDLERIVAVGRARRRRRRAGGLAGAVTVVAAGLALAPTVTNPSTAPPSSTQVHIRAVAYSVDSQADGTIRVTWSKRRYFDDHAGLEQALRAAGFPVTIKEGSFCLGPGDDAALNAGGVGPGALAVLHGGHQVVDGPRAHGHERTKTTGPGTDTAHSTDAGDAKLPAGTKGAVGLGTKDPDGENDEVGFLFRPSSVPAGKQLFIGFLDRRQLAVTGGRPGSVERLVSAVAPLTCTTELPHFGA